MLFNRRRGASTDAVGPSDDATAMASVGMEVLLLRADRARDAGDAETAARFYALVHQRAPDRQDIKVQLGNMLKDSGRLKEALAIYRDAQAVDPDDADICVQVARAYKLLGDRTRALEEFRKAAALDPYCGPATDELADAGLSWQQERRFEVDLRAGGAEAVMRLGHELSEVRAALDALREAPAAPSDAALAGIGKALDAIAATLPPALDRLAFPLAAYRVFRDMHPVPPPPEGPRVALTIILLADREATATLTQMLAALARQTAQGWTLLVVVADPERRAIAQHLSAADPRVRVTPVAEGDSVAAAEWRAARGVSEGWVVLLGQGAILQDCGLAWMAAAPALGASEAYVADEDRARILRGAIVREAPTIRQVPDYDTLLDANTLGETIAVSGAAYARLAPLPPPGSVARARSRLLLDLSRAGALGHIPHPLVSTLDAPRPSLPEHRLAVADHAEAHGFAARIAIAKGEKGATDWRPAQAGTPIAVLVMARDHPHELRHLLRTLRETALVPDSLHVVVVDTGDPAPDMRALIADVRTRRHVTLVAAPDAGTEARAANLAARATEAPIIVVVHDHMLMLSERWDDRLRGLLDRDDVGAVGARLVHGDGTLRHAGILLGWRGGEINDGIHEPGEAPGPARRFEVTRAVSAVTGAFLATRRDVFLAAGGFAEADLPEDAAAVDYCLTLRRQGMRILTTPAIVLRHLATKAGGLLPLTGEGRADGPVDGPLEARWGAALDIDPGLNPTWHPATLPFRLLAAPSQARVLGYLRQTARRDPWRVVGG